MPEPRGAGIALSLQMLERFDGSVDVFAEQVKAKDANIMSGPLDQPWNVRELTLLDSDGYRLVFTTPLHLNLSFDEVVKRAAGSG